MGQYRDGNFDIELYDDEPVAFKPYKCSESDHAFMMSEVNGLIDCDIVEPTISPWAFPAICVHRELQGIDKRRMVVDFRELNKRTKGDAFPMPDCDQVLSRLKAKKYYATLDIKSGFWQVALTKRAKEYSVFVTRDGQFAFKRMAFGLKNAPAYYQRMMQNILGELIGDTCLVYIDDVVCWGNTPEECLSNVRVVMDRLASKGIMCNGAKCCFLSTEIELLGHIVS